MMLDIVIELEKKNRTELNIIAKKLNLLRYHKLNKSKLIDLLLKQDEKKVNICLKTLGILKLREYFFAIGSVVMLSIFLVLTIANWTSVKKNIELNHYETGIADPLMEISLIFLTPIIVCYTIKAIFDIWTYILVPIIGCVILFFLFAATYFFLYGYLFDITHWLFYVSLCYFVWIFLMTIVAFMFGLSFKSMLTKHERT